MKHVAIAMMVFAAAPAVAGTAACGHDLLISGYFSNNVAVHDACSGAFLHTLDTGGRIRGAQAVRLNPFDDRVYVVSEVNGQIQRYRHDAGYRFVDVFAQFDDDVDPTGIAFGADGRVYVASYGRSSVYELDRDSGAIVATVLPPDSGLLGADNGLLVAGDGLIYVPGYDSSTVARIDPSTGQVEPAFVAAGSGGLLETRGIVDEGATILVGGEGSGTIHRYDAITGAHVTTLVTGLNRPTGLVIAPDGALLVLAGNRVRRYDRANGNFLGILASGVDGGISGGTFLALVPVAEVVFEDGFDAPPPASP